MRANRRVHIARRCPFRIISQTHNQSLCGFRSTHPHVPSGGADAHLKPAETNADEAHEAGLRSGSRGSFPGPHATVFVNGAAIRRARTKKTRIGAQVLKNDFRGLGDMFCGEGVLKVDDLQRPSNRDAPWLAGDARVLRRVCHRSQRGRRLDSNDRLGQPRLSLSLSLNLGSNEQVGRSDEGPRLSLEGTGPKATSSLKQEVPMPCASRRTPVKYERRRCRDQRGRSRELALRKATDGCSSSPGQASFVMFFRRGTSNIEHPHFCFIFRVYMALVGLILELVSVVRPVA